MMITIKNTNEHTISYLNDEQLELSLKKGILYLVLDKVIDFGLKQKVERLSAAGLYD